MFMQIAVGAVGIGIVLMVGYLIIAQVKSTLVNSGAATQTQGGLLNPCYNLNVTLTTAACDNSCNLAGWENLSTTMSCKDQNITQAMNSTQAVIFSGFALIAVGIIVLAAFGLINIFQ